jgi:hypothetical protein
VRWRILIRGMTCACEDGVKRPVGVQVLQRETIGWYVTSTYLQKCNSSTTKFRMQTLRRHPILNRVGVINFRIGLMMPTERYLTARMYWERVIEMSHMRILHEYLGVFASRNDVGCIVSSTGSRVITQRWPSWFNKFHSEALRSRGRRDLDH